METSSSRGGSSSREVSVDPPDPTWAEVAGRLGREFGSAVPSDEIDECVAQLAAKFADARIKTYVPVLLERQARQYLSTRVGTSVTGSLPDV